MSGSEAPREHETARSRAHRLLDAVPDERMSDAVGMLKRLAESDPAGRPRRRFRTVAAFDGDHDLGHRVKDIARGELGNGSSQPA